MKTLYEMLDKIYRGEITGVVYYIYYNEIEWDELYHTVRRTGFLQMNLTNHIIDINATTKIVAINYSRVSFIDRVMGRRFDCLFMSDMVRDDYVKFKYLESRVR